MIPCRHYAVFSSMCCCHLLYRRLYATLTDRLFSAPIHLISPGNCCLMEDRSQGATSLAILALGASSVSHEIWLNVRRYRNVPSAKEGDESHRRFPYYSWSTPQENARERKRK